MISTPVPWRLLESRFTPEALNALNLSRELAAGHGHAEVEPLDLLLALLSLGEHEASILRELLARAGANREELSLHIEAALTTGKPLPEPAPNWAPELRRIFVRATLAATREAPRATAPEHLLLGLASTPSGPHYSSVLQPLELTAAELWPHLEALEAGTAESRSRIPEPSLRLLILAGSWVPMLLAGYLLRGTPGPRAAFFGVFLLWEALFAGSVSFLAVIVSPMRYVRRRGIACLIGLALGALMAVLLFGKISPGP